MPQTPSSHPAAAPPPPVPHDDDYAHGYRDGLANEPAYVAGAGQSAALFADLFAPGAVAEREERYLRGYLQGQHDRQHPQPSAAAPGRPAEPR
ncbi:MAG TPA: hypothetical protein VKY89_13910 [Thermoanaerobaculia bacterium]|nr:hypothetical protein [Thermoanaerobaculia bacterium]